jgi:choline kinase
MELTEKLKIEGAAIILAAGLGKRLLGKANLDEKILHKCLINVGEVTLLNISISKLLSIGFPQIIVVTGYESEAVVESVRKKFQDSEVRFVQNHEYKEFGNMFTLLKGIESIDTNCVVLDADIIYERKAVKFIAEYLGFNGFVTTNKSGSGDEVFVNSSDEVVSEISKFPTNPTREVLSEYVGILTLSQSVLSHLKRLNPKDCGSIDYESYINFNLLNSYTFREFYIPDLVWTEIDTEMDFSKLRSWSLDKLEKVTLR